jgi:hypothetical protein
MQYVNIIFLLLIASVPFWFSTILFGNEHLMMVLYYLVMQNNLEYSLYLHF